MKHFKFDSDLILKIPETDNGISIDSNTAQIDFLKRHLSDLQREIGAIKEMTRHLSSINSVWDLMAGCGFSGKILQKYLTPDKILFNDLDPRCIKVLQNNLMNYSKTRITEKDIFKFPFENIPAPDLTFIDFNTFTLKRIQEWDDVLKKIKSQFLVITDSACFGFKFGNLKAYDCKIPADYYKKLDEWMWWKYGYYVREIYPFGPACLVLLSQDIKQANKGQGEIDEYPSTPIKIYIQDSKGFGL